ncbi:MAG: glutathione peroxidase [Bacteroidota bacterium]
MKLTLLILATMLTAPLTNTDKAPAKDIYRISINTLEGESLDLSQFKGKYILFVNVASKCGYTKQYAGLQELHEQYKDRLAIVGVPCNQFARQEPGTAEEIMSFCQKNYGVDFQMTEKVKVKGEEQHPLYAWLTRVELNGVEDSKVGWNFNKFLISPEGQYLAHFKSGVKPMSTEITGYLNE